MVEKRRSPTKRIGRAFVFVAMFVVAADSFVDAVVASGPPATLFSETFASVEAVFGDTNDYFVLFATVQAINSGSTQRRWSFSRTEVGTGTVFIGSGEFMSSDLSFKRGQVAFRRDGYVLDCAIVPSTQYYSERKPAEQKQFKLFDGSPELFSRTTSQFDQWSGLSCALSTPTQGTFQTGAGSYTKYRERKRSNADL